MNVWTCKFATVDYMGCAHSGDAKNRVKKHANKQSSVHRINVRGTLEKDPKCLERLHDLCILVDQTCHTVTTAVAVTSSGNKVEVITQSSSANSIDEYWTDEILSHLQKDGLIEIESFCKNSIDTGMGQTCHLGTGLRDSTGYLFGMLCIGYTGSCKTVNTKLVRQFAALIAEEIQQQYLDDTQAEAVAICNTAVSGWDLVWTCVRWDKLTGVETTQKFWQNFQESDQEDIEQDCSRTLHKDHVEMREDFSVNVISNQRKFNIMTMLFENVNADFLYFVRVCGITQCLEPSLSKSLDESEIEKPFCFEDIELGALLGAGGFGSVYRGIWKGQHIAVKIVDMPDNQDEGVMRQFLETSKQEANVMTDFDHRNIVKLYQSGTFYDRDGKMKLYILLQFCENGTVRAAIDRGYFLKSGLCNMRLLLRIALDISEGMRYLHEERRVVHGDLNCNNVLLDHEYRAKVADFGLTQYFDGKTRATSALGTVTHMAPEMLSEGKFNFKGDVYSFGVMLWEMYTGERAWAGLRQTQIMLAKMDERSLPLKIPEGAPQRFLELLRSCMAFEYKTRPDFQEICSRLQMMQLEVSV